MASGKKVDINKARVEDLEEFLIGVGHAKAEAIVEARKDGFKSVSDLMHIPGIGPGVLELNRSKLTCSSTPVNNRKSQRQREHRGTRSSARTSDQPTTSSGIRLRGHGSSSSLHNSMSSATITTDDGVANMWSSPGKEDGDSPGDGEPAIPRVSARRQLRLEDYMQVEESNSVSEDDAVHDDTDQHSHMDDEDVEETDDAFDDSDLYGDGGHGRATLRSRIPVPMSAVDKHWMKRKSESRPDGKGISPGKKQCRTSDSDGCSETSEENLSTSRARMKDRLLHPSRRKIPSRSNPPPELANWLKTFQAWSHAERLLALDELIEGCEATQVRHLMAVIEPQFQRDFISLLPKELALYVLSFLEPKDLCRAAQTCRYWRILAEDNLLWREKCREDSIDEATVFGSRIRRRSVSGSTRSSPWKSLFMRQHCIEQNWRTGEIRPPKVLKGHDDHVITCLEFSGTRIVSGSDDNTLKVWSAITGKIMRTLVGHTGGVWSSQMTGNIIISGSTDRTLKVWNADTGQCTHTLYGHTSTVRCMHLHENQVVSGSRDATLRLWDVDTGQCLHVLMGHVAAVRCVQYDGRRVVSGAYDYMVKVWDPESETCIYTLQGHTNRVYSLQFDGKHIVSGSLDTSIRVWDVSTGNCLHTLIGHQSLTSGMELKDNILVSGNADSTVKVWDITTGQCLQTLQGPNKHQSAVTCLQFNKKFVITSSDDGTVKIWDLRTGDFLRNLIALDSGGSGGVVWRIKANNTKLVCAVGSRNGTEETKLMVLDFDVEEPVAGLHSIAIK